MSLERTALRLAAVTALANNYVAPFPTMALDRVFDSRIDDLQGLEVRELVPTIIVYTDDDQGSGSSRNNGGPPFVRNVELLVDVSIGMIGEDDEHGLVVELPQTDAELDALLDLMEAQVERVFSSVTVGEWSRAFDEMHRGLQSVNSTRWVHSEGNRRVAMRTLKFMAELPMDCSPRSVLAGSPEDPAISGDTDPLPEPLKSFVQKIEAVPGVDPATHPVLQIATALRTHAIPSDISVDTPLAGVRIIEADGGGGNLTADDKARPDGVAHAEIETT